MEIRRIIWALPLLTIPIAVADAAVSNSAHELADGRFEKTVAVVVRDRSARIEYSLGLSDRTIALLIEAWQDQNAAGQKKKGYPGSSSLSGKLNSEKTDVVSDQDLMAEFRPLAFDKLANEIKVLIDGKPAKIEKVVAELSARHHFSLIAIYSFALPEKPSLKLSVEDKSFEKMPGAARYSLKALGSTLIINSNVAPIIVRAPRHVLDDLPPGQRSNVTRIDATLGWVQQK